MGKWKGAMMVISMVGGTNDGMEGTFLYKTSGGKTRVHARYMNNGEVGTQHAQEFGKAPPIYM